MLKILKTIFSACLFAFLMCVCISCGTKETNGEGAYIELLDGDCTFEYGLNASIPIAIVKNEKGEGVSYDAVCYKVIDPEGNAVDIYADSFTPRQVGDYILLYKYNELTKYFVISCNDTIKPVIKATVEDEYAVSDSYEDFEKGIYKVHEIPLYKVSDLSGVFAANTSLKVYLNGKERPVDRENSTFTLNESGQVVFEITARDENGQTDTACYESEATVPENFPLYCLSSFSAKNYRKLVGGGWLGSPFTSSIIDSYTDANGESYEGVLKIDYPATNQEAGLAITLGRNVKVSDIDYISVTLCAKNLSCESSGAYNVIVYKKSPFWENPNLPAAIEDNVWTTLKIPASMLRNFTDLDGDTVSGFAIETMDYAKAGRTIYLADISYGYNATNLNVTAVSGNATNVNIVTDANFAEMGNSAFITTGTLKKNEEITAFSVRYEGNNIIIDNFGGASSGDELSIDIGFGVKFAQKAYETTGQYVFKYNGTKWDFCMIMDVTGLLDNPKTVRAQTNCIYITFDRNLYTGSNKWATLTHNQKVALNGTDIIANLQICEWNRDLYFSFNGMNVNEGGTFLIKKGFELSCNGVYYRVNRDVLFTYVSTAGGWIIGEPVITGFEDVNIKKSGSVIKDAIYVRENADIFGTTKISAWYTLSYVGKIYFERDGIRQEKTLNLQICGWPNDLYFSGFGIAEEGDKLIFEKGLSVIVKGRAFITDKTYEYTFEEDGWTLTDILD